MSLKRLPPRHSLIDVLDRVLDKGLVIEASVKVSLLGIEIVGVDACIVVESIQTYKAVASNDKARASNTAEIRSTAPPMRRRSAKALASGAVPRRHRRSRDTVNARCEHGCTFVMKGDALASTVTCPFDGSRMCSIAPPAS